MSKVPVSAPSEVQQSFREVWESLDPFLRTNIDLSGRRFINAGNARSASDFVTQQQVADKFGFEAFYDELKKRGLDGFPGRLSEPQDAIAAAYPDPPPSTHDIGQIYYDPVSEQLKIVTDAGIIVLTSGAALTAESGSGDVARLDGTGEFTGARTISGLWTFTSNLILSNILPQITMEDTTTDADDFYIKVNADTWWVASADSVTSIFGCTATRFDVWKPAYFAGQLWITASSSPASAYIECSAGNSVAELQLANDARRWVIKVNVDDSFRLTDSTAPLDRMIIETSGNITLAGTIVLDPGPVTIKATAPRLTLEDITASAHNAYLQMDSDIFQINVDTDTILTCGKTYTYLQREATIAGSGQKLAFFGGTRQSKTTVAGLRDGGAALTALLSVLHDYGLIDDQTN